MIPVIEAPLQEDLTEFTAFLWQHSIPHRVLEEGERQVLWVADTQDPVQLQELYRYWRNGGDLARVQVQEEGRRRRIRPVDWTELPVTLSLIVLSFVVSFFIGFGADLDRMSWFSFTPFEVRGNAMLHALLGQTLMSGEVWRLVTPIFMHFSLLHILFNLLWVWIVGTRMEPSQGSLSLLALALFSGIASNLAQYLVSGPMFGGMSGVVFALLAYSWLWDRQGGRPRIGLPPALMGMLLLWLALGFTGVLEGVGLGSIANTAHLVGLLAGLCWLPIGRLLNRRQG
ncbi:rhomboid family intramembrane serine protease [Marinobacterium sediminicola]|uniref:GlpG protein n=1 Tax=Marinobacterium sediminicola TaxID=518898 RepID=A0ABY1RWZ4_9GAMM|nr:rhomboid family intramembrane serine protease [Marinobacterium sediminicola]ULG67963.1 rhomboid family intramembrane serine protease [Marinobacterium sediminicola]SMR71301.1 GlpG protein [Marinobacterium sediminicola]